MTYEAAFEDNSEILLDGALGEANLFVLAGAPSQAVTITFVLTAYSFGQTAIRAGNFASGSKIILILANGFEGKANGGSGGKGADGAENTNTPPPNNAGNGLNGGTVYDAQGVDTDIYFSGSTPSAAYPTADGYIFAPNGGSGGFNYLQAGPNAWLGGSGGDGGNGRLPGTGGAVGAVGDISSAGSNGNINDTG
ncbi:MAG: hypothetical protein GY819_14965, partial [Planctomycetaceae bacterium]|nr:hypothetical protein [Planctomycetaceae bacterium]